MHTLDYNERGLIERIVHKELKEFINLDNSAFVQDYFVVQLKNGFDLEVEYSTKKFRDYLRTFQIDNAINYIKNVTNQALIKNLFRGGQ